MKAKKRVMTTSAGVPTPKRTPTVRKIKPAWVGPSKAYGKPGVTSAGAAGRGGEPIAALGVADVAGGSLERTPIDLLSRASAGWVVDLAWSAGTKLVADAIGSSASVGDSLEQHVLVMDAADLSKLTDLGEGHLSVWVR